MEIIKDRQLVLFGASNLGGSYLKFLKKNNIEPVYFTDNDKRKWGNKFLNLEIIPPSLLDKEKHLVMVASMYIDEVSIQLKNMGFEDYKNIIYFENFFKWHGEYSFRTTGDLIPNSIQKRLDLKDYIKLNDNVTINYFDIQQDMKDMKTPKTLQNFQYPSYMLPQQAKPSGPVYYADFKGMYTYDDTGAIFDAKGTMVSEFSSYNSLSVNIWDAQRYKMYKFNELNPIPFSVHVEGTVGVACSIWGKDNFYHWLFEELPRLYLLQKSGVEIDRYVCNFEGRKFQVDTLNKMGIDIDKIILSSKAYAIHADRMLVPYAPAYDSGYVSPWICEFLRDLYHNDIDKTKVDSPKKIYIARGKASHKLVLNEDEVIEYLEGKGFKICFMEDYTMEEQASLFYHADVIVAAHGAGLSHLVHCRPGTKLLEIFNPVYVPTMFWCISDQVGVDYYCSIGEKTEYEYTEEIESTINNRDIIVRMEDIKKFLLEISGEIEHV